MSGNSIPVIPANPENCIINSRLFICDAATVFAAFADAGKLARWWGPAGFSNTFAVFEFRPGGQWRFTMHGPDGRDYANESVFTEIEPERRIVIRHVCEPVFELSITLEPEAGGTRLHWCQAFASQAFCEQNRSFLTTCNEENLDRLAAVLQTEV